MNRFTFTNKGKKSFDKLPRLLKSRILTKLKFFKSHPNIFAVLVPLIEFQPATHRLRVGDYRIILEYKTFSEDIYDFWVLDLDNRASVYKN